LIENGSKKISKVQIKFSGSISQTVPGGTESVKGKVVPVTGREGP
jgi:hypothetical protein